VQDLDEALVGDVADPLDERGLVHREELADVDDALPGEVGLALALRRRMFPGAAARWTFEVKAQTMTVPIALRLKRLFWTTR